MSPAADLKIIRDFLDWDHAVHGSFATEDFHRQLVAERRPMPTVADARAALTRLEEADLQTLLTDAENQLLITETSPGYEKANIAVAARIHAVLPTETENQ